MCQNGIILSKYFGVVNGHGMRTGPHHSFVLADTSARDVALKG